ncbi:unannotated protein [freshwater metagenome]|uniref:Unannotated protein n=1 Tax=freshwater metagenome TaxID=449393 RepID=A0A6J7BPK5_9ZZZZ|nr:EamA family transporter RarD [Actinomycetota bacterium]MSW36876.1 EamA family transporter RarD [Actinomycetota bacterium]MSX38003.1 EamA family transporter RarD [Actinomycetota bacterium]
MDLHPHHLSPAEKHARSSLRLGLASGVGAYAIWGLFPLFWPLLEPASAIEMVCGRIVWSFPFLVLLLTATRAWPRLRPVLRSPRTMLLLFGAALCIGVNWMLFIWSVANHHVVEASLGYFINPLVTVVFGTLVLRERLRTPQWIAVGVAALAVAVLTGAYGYIPWIGLGLALSFAAYGLVKKVAGVDPVTSLVVETGYWMPLATGTLIWLGVNGTLAFAHTSPANTVLIVSSGIVTAIPLLLFGSAANRVPLSTVGILQYLTPSIQFVIGIKIGVEDMSPARWLGFSIIWLALVVFTYDGVRQSHVTRSARLSLIDTEGVEAPV